PDVVAQLRVHDPPLLEAPLRPDERQAHDAPRLWPGRADRPVRGEDQPRSSRQPPGSPTSTTSAMSRKIPASTTPGMARAPAATARGSAIGPKSVSRMRLPFSVK